MVTMFLPPRLLLYLICAVLLLLPTTTFLVLAATPSGDYVAARGTFYCYNRPFRGVVRLINCAISQQFSEFHTMDHVHTDPEGTFELLGKNPHKNSYEFNACIYVAYDCKVPPPPSAFGSGTQSLFDIEAQARMDQDWRMGVLNEKVDWKMVMEVLPDPKKPDGPEPSANSLNDNDSGIGNGAKQFLMLMIPNGYFSEQEVPSRFFELGRINLAGKIRQKRHPK